MSTYQQKLVAWDTETHLIVQGNQTPPIVCHMFGFFDADGIGTADHSSEALIRQADGLRSELYLKDAGYQRFMQLLEHTDCIFIGVNLCFDIAVLLQYAYGIDQQTFDHVHAQILHAMRQGRFSDLMIRERLLCFWHGVSHLPCDMDGIVSRRLGLDIRSIKRGDSWRLRYGELDGVPLELWPQEAVDYCHGDALMPLLAFIKQLESAEEKAYTDPTRPWFVRTETWELRAQWALYTASCWGIICDPVRASRLFETADTMFQQYQEDMVASGLASWSTKGGVPVYAEKRAAIQTAIRESYLQKFIDDHPSEDWRLIDGVWTSADGQQIQKQWLPEVRKLTAEGRKKLLASGIPAAELPETEERQAQEIYVFRGVCITPVGEPSKTFPQGQISYGREIQLDSGDPDLEKIAQESEWKKIKQTYVPIIERGVKAVINPRFNGLGAITTRTSSSHPNLQNIPTFADVRETIIAREGRVLCSIDTAQAELVAWGVWCKRMFGQSDMLDMINAGVDVHCYTATKLPEAIDHGWGDWHQIKKMTKSSDRDTLVLAKRLRQYSKIVNFSRPGGGGANSLIGAAKRQGVSMTATQAEQGIQAFDAAFRESKLAARWASEETAFCGGRYTCDISGVSIGERLYTQLRNITFQSRVAQFTKEVCILLIEKAFADKSSALYRTNARLAIMVHDEIILELDYDRDPALCTEAVREAEALFQRAGMLWLPGAVIAAEGGIARAWIKNRKRGTEITPEWKDGLLLPCDQT